MAARRCADSSNGNQCASMLHTWDKHDTCLSHRPCSKDNTCTRCESWGEKEWNAIPLRIKKASHKRKDKKSSAVTRSLLSSQDESEAAVSAEVVTAPLQGSTKLSSDNSVASCSTLASQAQVEQNTISLAGGENILVTASDMNPKRAKKSVNTLLTHNSGGQTSVTQTSGSTFGSNKQGPVPACAGSATLVCSELDGDNSEHDSPAEDMTSWGYNLDYNRGDRSLSGTTRGSTSQLPVGDFAAANPNAQQSWGMPPWGTPAMHMPGQPDTVRAATGGVVSGQMKNPWPAYPPFPWGGYGPHMGWFPQGFGMAMPPQQETTNTQREGLHAAATPAVGWPWPSPPPGFPFPQPTVDNQQVREQEIPRFVVPKVPHQKQKTPVPRTASSGDLITQDAECTYSGAASPMETDCTSGEESQNWANSDSLEVEGDEHGSEPDTQRQELPLGSSTYEEALSNVRPFLASLQDPQGYPISMEAPVASNRRRVTSLLESTESTTPHGGLPWTLDVGSAQFSLNLSLRGVPRSQHNRYVAEGLPLPPPDSHVMGKGAFPGRFTGGADAAFFRSYPYQLPGLGETVDLPSHIPEIPQRLSAAHRKPPTQVNLSWRAACNSEKLTRQQASLLSHASWWDFALQRRLLSLSENICNMQPEEVAEAIAEAASWAQAGLTVTTKALVHNQTLMSQFLLLRRDAVLDQTRLPRSRSSLLRSAPLQSADLFGPNFDGLASIWTTEDEQAKTLGGGKPQPFRRPTQQEGRKPFTPPIASGNITGRGGRAGRGWRNRRNSRGASNLSGPKLPQGGPQQPPKRK